MAAVSIASLNSMLAMARDRFVFGLERVPDDRLNWSPSEDARTPLQLAAAYVLFQETQASYFQTRSLPERGSATLPVFETREAAQAAVTASCNRLIDVLNSLSEEDLQASVMAFWQKEVSLEELVAWVGYVAGYWQGQLNYLQTAYGDKDPNIPPGWGY